MGERKEEEQEEEEREFEGRVKRKFLHKSTRKADQRLRLTRRSERRGEERRGEERREEEKIRVLDLATWAGSRKGKARTRSDKARSPPRPCHAPCTHHAPCKACLSHQ